MMCLKLDSTKSKTSSWRAWGSSIKSSCTQSAVEIMISFTRSSSYIFKCSCTWPPLLGMTGVSRKPLYPSRLWRRKTSYPWVFYLTPSERTPGSRRAVLEHRVGLFLDFGIGRARRKAENGRAKIEGTRKLAGRGKNVRQGNPHTHCPGARGHPIRHPGLQDTLGLDGGLPEDRGLPAGSQVRLRLSH